jgi:hypothetical protein
MRTSTFPFRRSALGFVLGLSAVIALTLALQDISAHTMTPAASPEERSELTQAVALAGRVTDNANLTAHRHDVQAITEVHTDTCQWDVALAFDRSNSMQEGTRCYGCWEADENGEPYPAGVTFPLPFGEHCQASNPLQYQVYWYVVIEAEHYSSYESAADYHRAYTEYPKTWWAMQRQPRVNTSGPDERGAFMKVGPNSEGAMHYNTIADIVFPTDIDPYFTTPRLDYDFTVPAPGTYYVWMRAQGGVSYWDNAITRLRVHVGLNGAPLATGETRRYGPYNDGADPDHWRWTRVLELPNLAVTGSEDPYTLNFWAAGPGFSLDKIVITNDPGTYLDGGNRPLDWDYTMSDGTVIDDYGPLETHGRTNWACMTAEDPRFEPINPLTEELDDLYDDYQPIRAAKEAAKNFVRLLNPKLDQVGYVRYGTSSEIVEELYCLEREGGCEGFENVLVPIDSTQAEGWTNIADALWDGLWVLTTGTEPEPSATGVGLPPKFPGTEHYGRPGAVHVLILMTDGKANYYPGIGRDGVPNLPPDYGNCYSDDLYPDQPDETLDQRRARECVAWFALHARDRGVEIYTIGLGTQSDNDLLAYVARLTNGSHLYVPSPSELEDALEAIETQLTTRCPFAIQVAKRVTPEDSINIGERLTYTIRTTVSGRARPSLWLTDYWPTQTLFITATAGYTPASPIRGEPLVWQVAAGSFTQPLVLAHTVALSVAGPEGVLTNTVVVVDDAGLTSATASIAVTVVGPEKHRLYLPLVLKDGG